MIIAFVTAMVVSVVLCVVFVLTDITAMYAVAAVLFFGALLAWAVTAR